jgi:hypothetical protein
MFRNCAEADIPDMGKVIPDTGRFAIEVIAASLSRTLLFAGNADGRPGDGIEARQADFSFADIADAVFPFINSFNGSFNGTKQFGIDLEQSKVHVHFVIITCLIYKVSVAGICHIIPVSLLAGGVGNGVPLLLKSGSKPLEILLIHNPFLNEKSETIDHNWWNVNHQF